MTAAHLLLLTHHYQETITLGAAYLLVSNVPLGSHPGKLLSNGLKREEKICDEGRRFRLPCQSFNAREFRGHDHAY